MDSKSGSVVGGTPSPAWRDDPLADERPRRALECPSVLSDLLLQDLRVERVSAHILHASDEVALQANTVNQPILYSVLSGSLTLAMPDEPTAVLGPGENALLFFGDSHRLGNGNRQVALSTLPPGASREHVEHLYFGAGNELFVVLRCVMELAYVGKSAHATRASPKLLLQRVPSSEGEAPPVTSFSFSPRQLLASLSGPGAIALATAFANTQLCYALKQWTEFLWGEAIPNLRNPNTRRVATIIREMRAHPDRSWTVAEMARHCGLSRSAFAAVFSTMTGEAPMVYLTRERMERAGRLLGDSSLSMHEVGRRVGYAIESSFARAFKRHWGVAPRRYVNPPGQRD